MASQAPSAATPRCSTPSASSDWLQSATRPGSLCAAFTRQLLVSAPAYLRPSAQTILLTTAADCLHILERAVNWEAERLYGVEGLGPFDEF